MIETIRVEFCGKEQSLFQSANDFTHIKTLTNFSLVQSLTGSYGIQIDKSPVYNTNKGGMFIAPPQYEQIITHHLDKGSMEARWLFLNIEINNACSAELLYDFPVIPPEDVREKLNKLLDSMFSATDPFDIMSISYQISKAMLSCAKEKNTQFNSSVMSVLDYIKKNYDKNITISQLANLVHISESNLYASFKKQMSVSPIAYLNDYRLATASRLLKSSSDSIEEISHSVGIEDVRYFAKIFKRKYQMTPSAYRKNIFI